MTTQITSFEQFIPLAITTESKFDTVSFNKGAFRNILKAAIAAGNLLDFVKKAVAYGKPINIADWNTHVANLGTSASNLEFYDSIQLDRKENIALNPRLFHGVTGIATEGAELLEAMELALDTGIWDGVNIKEEVSDIAWYEAILLDELGDDMNSLLTRLIGKLQTRYPEKFTAEAAINRNLAAERAILES